MNWLSRSGVATRAIILINIIVYLGQIASNGALTDMLSYSPLSTFSEPWRMITAGFAHDDSLATNATSVFHIGLNMYSVYILGNLLEPMLEAKRFVALYLLSILGGSVAVLVWGSPATTVIGASGGVFGLMAAYFVVLKTLGQNPSTVLGVIAINLVFSFMSSGISWEAHVGGLVVGAAVTLLYANTRRLQQASLQNMGLIGIALALVLIAFIRMNALIGMLAY